jgi:hypothetical protein
MENLAHLDPMAHLEMPERTVVQDHPVHQDPTDHPDHLVRMERKEDPVHRPNQYPQHPEMLDHPARMAHLDPQVKMELQDPMVAPAQQDPKDHPAQLDPLATMVLPVTRAHPDPMDHQERRVFAPNTAPPMVVCSSRMEQDDKQPRRESIHFPTGDNGTDHNTLRLDNYPPLIIVILLASMSFAPFKRRTALSLFSDIIK